MPPAGPRAFWDWDELPGIPGKDDAKTNKVHIRMQQRNGRKSWTTVAGFPEKVRLPKSGNVLQVDFEKILRALKKTFKTNGVLVDGGDHGRVMQLQGDIRKEVAEFLIEVTAIITKDQVMIHGS
ncbi:SUI1A [Symbiodinium pilosum]|uniref:SUI1A protein n=1 Tax=Symbiodinium pilosum TaxID=2952 RepID=A0A812MK70_SYMPI|nr:SUI1A [Symbiodinium pilosum]